MSTKGENRFDSTEASPWMRPFVPRRFLSNGHLQTIVGNFLPRTDSLPELESQLIEVEAATSARGASFVLCHCHWQPAEVRSERLTMVIVHGLEGSSSSPYVRGNSARAWKAGCNVVRMNMRSCGAGEHLSPSIYHAGRSEDVAIVMAELARAHLIRSFALVGYSMGGNLVLKLAGELGDAPPPYLKAVVGVSPLMDLVASAAALHEPQNRLYESRFLADLLKRFRHKVELYPGLYSADGLNKIRTMRRIRRTGRRAIRRLRERRRLLPQCCQFQLGAGHYRAHADPARSRRSLHPHDFRDPRQAPRQQPRQAGRDSARRPLRLSIARTRRRRLLGGENATRLSARNGRRLTVYRPFLPNGVHLGGSTRSTLQMLYRKQVCNPAHLEQSAA